MIANNNNYSCIGNKHVTNTGDKFLISDQAQLRFAFSSKVVDYIPLLDAITNKNNELEMDSSHRKLKESFLQYVQRRWEDHCNSTIDLDFKIVKTKKRKVQDDFEDVSKKTAFSGRTSKKKLAYETKC